MYPVYRLHSFVETAADNFQLVFAAQFHEVYGISGNADGELRIFLRMFHGVFQHFTVQYVHVEVVCTFGASIMVTRFSTRSSAVGPNDFGTMENVLLIPSCESR